MFSLFSLLDARGDAFQVCAVNIGERTCRDPCHFASASMSRPRDPPPPCRRKHRLSVHGPPNAVGALRATLAGDVFESLGNMPETRRTSTTVERSEGCGVTGLRTVGGGVSGRGSARRQRLAAASSAPPPRAAATDFAEYRSQGQGHISTAPPRLGSCSWDGPFFRMWQGVQMFGPWSLS
jgi:hypothetical protein